MHWTDWRFGKLFQTGISCSEHFWTRSLTLYPLGYYFKAERTYRVQCSLTVCNLSLWCQLPTLNQRYKTSFYTLDRHFMYAWLSINFTTPLIPKCRPKGKKYQESWEGRYLSPFPQIYILYMLPRKIGLPTKILLLYIWIQIWLGCASCPCLFKRNSNENMRIGTKYKKNTSHSRQLSTIPLIRHTTIYLYS